MRMLLRVLALLTSALPIAGCGATVLGENKQGIWFREPFIGFGGMESAAERHCAQFGKTAERVGTLDPGQGYTLPVVAFNCK
jgi:hypothetical protein